MSDEKLPIEQISIPKIAEVEIHPGARPQTGRVTNPGSVGKIVGDKAHAPNNIIYIVIRYCFAAASLITVGLFLDSLREHHELKFEHIEITWSIFIPVITGALGYVFGKGRE